MATIILNQNETSTIANDGDVVRGRQAGAEAIRIESGVSNIETNAELERIDLPAFSSSDLTFQVTENGLAIGDGSNTIVTVPSLNQDLNLRLTDGNVILSQTGAQEFTLTNPGNSEDTATIGTEATSINVGLGDDEVPPTGTAEIQGTPGNDLISPDAENEDLVTSDSDENIGALGGNDTIDGGGGADTVLADSGNDVLVGDPNDEVLDGQEGFDTLQIREVGDSKFGSDSDDISLEPVTNVQLIDTTNSQGGNTFDLSDSLVDSVTGGENTLGVLENNLALLVGGQDDEIDLGDITPPSGSFQPGDEPPITIQVVFAGEGVSADSNNIEINNPGSARVRLLDFGDTSVVGENSFDVKAGPSYYVGTNGNDTVNASLDDLDLDNNDIANDTIAAADGEDTLALSGNVKGNLPLAPFAFFSGFDVLDLSGENTTVEGNLILDNELVGQFTRGEPTVEGADTLTVVGSGNQTIDTQDVSKDDTIIIEGGDFTLANPRSDSTLLQGNIVTISDNGAGTVFGSEGNDSVNGGSADDVIDLSPQPPQIVSSGNNVVSGGEGNDDITAGTGQDNLSGDEGNDTFNFGLNNSGVSRLNANDTVSGGEGTDDTVNLVPNTVLASQSEVQNVTEVETIQLNGDGDASSSSPVSSDSTPVNNEFTVIQNLVDTTSGNTTLTIDAASNNFNLINNDNFTLTNGGTFDRNVIDLTNLSADSEIAVEGGNASEQLIFSDASFNGLFELNGGQGGIDANSVGLPVAGNFQFTPSVTLPVSSGTVSENNPRLNLANSVSNLDTLQFEAEDGNTFTADQTDFNNVSGFEEIQLTNTQDGALSNFNITLNDEIVRELTQPASTDTSTNLFVSLDVIDQIDNTSLGQEIGQDSNITIDATELTSTLNTVTVLNPNGVQNISVDGPNTNQPTRVNVLSNTDIISTAELGQANGRLISNDYANPAVSTVIANNLDDEDTALLSFDQAGNTANTVVTGNGDFSISTGGGDDNITTGNGDDTLTGGQGVDTLEGGEGADVYNFDTVGDSPSGTPDTVIDFVAGTDQIDVRDLGFDRFFGNFQNTTVAQASAAADGGNVLAFASDSNSLIGFQGGNPEFEISFENPEVELGELAAGDSADTGDILGAVDAERPELSTVSFANTSLTVDESDDSANLTIQLSEALPSDSAFNLTFTVSTSENTATSVDDFSPLDEQEFTIPAGESSVEIPIEINNDNEAEDSESFDVSFATESNFVEVADSTATVTIEDDDGGANNPTFGNAGSSFTVAEDATDGTDVGVVQASDNGSVEEFAITGGNTDVDGDDNDAFAIDNNGQISVNDADDLVADGDSDPFSLTVQVTDNQGNTATASYEVDVTPADDNGGGLPDLPGNGGPAEVDQGTGEPENINGDQDGATLSGGAGTDRIIFDNVVNDQGDPQAQSVTIDDFAQGEQLFFEGGFSSGDISVENQSATDGQVVLGIRNTDITITGLSEQDDGSILGVTGFENVFGDQALAFA